MSARANWATVRAERGRARRLGKLGALLRPYRGRVALMFVALLVATGAGLAPPYLAGRAIDDGIVARDVSSLHSAGDAASAHTSVSVSGTGRCLATAATDAPRCHPGCPNDPAVSRSSRCGPAGSGAGFSSGRYAATFACERARRSCSSRGWCPPSHQSVPRA